MARDLIPYLKENGIGLVNASPNAMGLLTNRGPPKWHPATDEIKKVCVEAAKYCDERGVDISKIAMHFCIHTHPEIATTLVSTASLENLRKNIAAVNDSLSDFEL